MRRLIIWVPLLVFVFFVATVAVGLYAPSERVIRSKMIGKPMPEFALPQALPGRPALQSADLRDGQPHIINVFASWCVPCIA